MAPVNKGLRYGLKESVIEKMCAVFARYSQIERVILYGSRAKGNYRDGSDVDLTLVGNNLDLSLQFKVAGELDELMLPYKVDLSLMQQIENPKLIEHIERVGVEFYPGTA